MNNSSRDLGLKANQPEEEFRELFCGGISLTTTQKDIEEYFEKFGVIKQLRLVNQKTSGNYCHQNCT